MNKANNCFPIAACCEQVTCTSDSQYCKTHERS